MLGVQLADVSTRCSSHPQGKSEARCLVYVLSRPECQIKTDRSRLVKSNCERVTAALSKAENKPHFDDFAG